MSKKEQFGTFIHGIAASEHLDSSGERIIVDGVDISSLTKDGVFNFEHQSKEASHIVGKILEAKKIFKKSDCDNDYHRHFWDKVQMPFIYVAGELFDHVGHSAAQDVAAMLKYDKNLNKDETKALVNFSIEGSRLAKDGSNITKCIARKVSITITPCNKMAHAEHMEKPSEAKKADSIDISKEILSKFKKSEAVEIEVMSKAEKKYYTNLYNKQTSKMNPENNPSSKQNFKPLTPMSGKTKEGSMLPKPKRTFTPENAPDKIKVGDRIDYSKRPRAKTGAEIYNDPDTFKSEKKKKSKKKFYESNVRKAITASCGMGAPSSKVQGDALQKEKILKHLADETWKDYDKKDELVDFLTEKYPDMNKSEVMAVAKTYVYIDIKKKEMALEKARIDDGKTPREKALAREARKDKPIKGRYLNEKQYENQKRTARTPRTTERGKQERKQALADVIHTHKEDKKFGVKRDKKGKIKNNTHQHPDDKTTVITHHDDDKTDKLAASEKTLHPSNNQVSGKVKQKVKDIISANKQVNAKQQKRKEIREKRQNAAKENAKKLKQVGIEPKFDPLEASEKDKVEQMNLDLKKKKKEKPFHGYNKEKHSREGGLSEKERNRINRETGSNLKKPVSSKEAKKSPKKAARRKSFCARMSGNKGPTSKDGKLTPKGAALKRWDC